MSSNYPIALGIARYVKKINRNALVIFGGPQATLTANETISTYDFIDLIVMGEAESTFPQLLLGLKGDISNLNDIKGICYRIKNRIHETARQELIDNLNSLENLDFSCINLDDYKWCYKSKTFFLPVEAGRGCPFDCKFCSTSLFWRRKYRVKSPERIVREIESYSLEYDVRKFKLAHDNLTFNGRFLCDLCAQLKNLPIKFEWFANSRMEHVSPKALKMLRDSKCTSLFYGIESLNGKFLKGRKYTPRYFRRFLRKNIENGIVPILSFIYGFPGETEKDIEHTLNHIISSKLEGANKVLLSQLVPEVRTGYYEENKNSLVTCDSILSEVEQINGFPTAAEIKEHPELFTHFYRIKSRLLIDNDILPFIERFYGAAMNMIPRSIMFLHILSNMSFVDIASILYSKDETKHLFDEDVYERLSSILSTFIRDDLNLRYLRNLLKYELAIYELSIDGLTEKKTMIFDTNVIWFLQNLNRRFFKTKFFLLRKWLFRCCTILLKKNNDGFVNVYALTKTQNQGGRYAEDYIDLV